MTTIASATPFDMEFLQPEDSMELASSPHMSQEDDLDLDLDTMHEPDVAPEDSMVEGNIEGDQLEPMDHFNDDEMVDEDNANQHFADNASDLDMEAHHGNETALEDEDILYEDEEAPKDSDVAQSINDAANIDAEHSHTRETLGLISVDAEVAETRVENEVASTEQDTEKSPLIPASHVTEVKENQEPDQEEHYQSVEAEDISQAPVDTNIEAYDWEQANAEMTTETGMNLTDSTASTNPINPTETIPESEVGDQETTEVIDNTTKEIADEQHDHLGGQDVAVHTVKVIYEDSEICLFPPQSGEDAGTFFLSDQSLAHDTLDKLLASCRAVLADTIGDDDELVLDVVSLGLHISEGSKYAANITLSQILDVYLTLSRNENIEQTEPLYCNLSSRVCLASQYAYLAAAAQEGKTITEITAEHMDSPGINQYEDEQKHVEDAAEEYVPEHEATEVGPPEIEQTGPGYVDYAEERVHRDDNGTTNGQKDDPHLEIPLSTDNVEASKDGKQGDLADTDPTEHIEAVESSNVPLKSASPYNTGIQPDLTEVQEDIDELANGDPNVHAQEQASGNEQRFEALSANDETISSGTVEAEVEDGQVEQFGETAEQDDLHLEAFADNDYNQHQSISGEHEAQDKAFDQAAATATDKAEPLQLEEGNDDDFLDLGPEDQDDLSLDEIGPAAKYAETEIQDPEDDEDFIVEADASTDQTVDNIPQDEEDNDPNAFAPPATPATTRSAKRKVDAEDEDDFELFDTETPEKKRGRPS